MELAVTYDFEWDPAKALSNAHKHDVTFDQAATVFLDALALTVFFFGRESPAGRAFVHARIELDRQALGCGAHLSVRRLDERSGTHRLRAQSDQA